MCPGHIFFDFQILTETVLCLPCTHLARAEECRQTTSTGLTQLGDPVTAVTVARLLLDLEFQP